MRGCARVSWKWRGNFGGNVLLGSSCKADGRAEDDALADFTVFKLKFTETRPREAR